MAAAQAFIPQTDQFTTPKGLDISTTPQGGSAYTDTLGTYGAKGAQYIKGVNGYTLAPTTLEGNQSVSGANATNGSGFNTPAPQVQVQPAGTTVKTAPTGEAAPMAVDPLSPQAQAVSKALEEAANSGGQGLSAVPVKGAAAPPVTRDTFSLSDVLGKIGPAPTQPDANAIQSGAENQLGVPAMRDNITNLTQQLSDLQNNLQSEQAQEASKPGVVATIVNGRMRMLSAEQSKALNDLKSQISSATKNLSNANTAVASIMKNGQTDYANAEKAYEFSYSKAIAVYQDEQNQQNKEQTAAKANAQVIINSYKGSANRADSITPEMESQWNNLELQAGLPAGTVKAAVDAELNIEKFYKGNDGNMYAVQVVNGVPQTIKIGYAGGTTSQANGKNGGGGTPTQQAAAKLKADTSKMSGALNAAKGTDGMVSNADWNAALKDWIAEGYATAQFNTAFKSYKSTNK